MFCDLSYIVYYIKACKAFWPFSFLRAFSSTGNERNSYLELCPDNAIQKLQQKLLRFRRIEAHYAISASHYDFFVVL